MRSSFPACAPSQCLKLAGASHGCSQTEPKRRRSDRALPPLRLQLTRGDDKLMPALKSTKFAERRSTRRSPGAAPWRPQYTPRSCLHRHRVAAPASRPAVVFGNGKKLQHSDAFSPKEKQFMLLNDNEPQKDRTLKILGCHHPARATASTHQINGAMFRNIILASAE